MKPQFFVQKAASIQLDINTLLATPSHIYHANRQTNDAQLKVLRTCKYYAETKPKKKFLQKEKRRLKVLIASQSDGFALWSCLQPRSESYESLVKKYESEVELPKHRNHLKAIEYLLAD